VRVYAAATASRKLRGVGGETGGTMTYAVVDVEEIPYQPWPLPEE
jgi:hypothetical protein